MVIRNSLRSASQSGAPAQVGSDGFVEFDETAAADATARFKALALSAGDQDPLAVDGDSLDNILVGTASADVLRGLGGADRLSGLGGDDILDGGDGDDILMGGDGDDILIGGLGNDVLAGGAGRDTADYSSAGAAVTVNLATGRASGGAGLDTLTSIENLVGSVFNDTLIGDANANIIRGGGGSDTIDGGGGDDQLFAGPIDRAGNAPDIVKARTTANVSTATSISLDNGFDLLPSDTIVNATTIPHATVQATTHGGYELYAFTVAANTTVTIDIDDATFAAGIRIMTSDQVSIPVHAHSASDVTGNGLSFTLAQAGTYYIQVSERFTNTLTGATIRPPAAGESYTLHVSVPNHLVSPQSFVGSTLNGGDGNDILTGGDGNDRLDGGNGVDTAVYSQQRSAYTVTTVNGVTTISQGQNHVDTLTNVEWVQFADQRLQLSTSTGTGVNLVGTGARDVLVGTAFADTFTGAGGPDYIDGGDDVDTIIMSGPVTQYFFEAISTGGWRVYDRLTGFSSVFNVENVVFGNGPSMSMETAAGTSFDAYNYIAGHSDLLAVYGSSPASAYLHYFAYGQSEGRSANPFDVLRYVASNPDLIPIFQDDLRGATRHYVFAGAAEGRSTTSFDALLYAASNRNVAVAFGNDVRAITEHYVNIGFEQGLPTAGFDVLQYLASNPDLARTFGTNVAAGLNFYLTTGLNQVRPLDTFDAREYAAANRDVAIAYGFDEVAAREHYLTYGARQNRPTTGFDEVAYVLSNGDLGITPAQALDHWLTVGAVAGRESGSAFLGEQTSHLPGATGYMNTSFGVANDKDWFVVTGQAGQTLTAVLDGVIGGRGFFFPLRTGTVELYDETGRLIATRSQTSGDAPVTLTHLFETSGTFYIVLSSAIAQHYRFTANVATVIPGAAEGAIPDPGPQILPDLQADKADAKHDADDAFVLPPLSDPSQADRPDLHVGVDLAPNGFEPVVDLTDATVPTLPLPIDDLTLWHRLEPGDAWIMQ